MITEQQAVELAEKEYPGCSAEVVADVEGLYYVNIFQNGETQGFADIHTVNKNTGEVSGNIPLGKVLENEQVVSQITGQQKKKMK